MLFAIGAGERVIATDEFSDFPEAAAALPKLTYSSPDPEQALALDPDLVLMSGRQSEQVEQFRSLGMTVFYLEEAADLDGVLSTVTLLGLVTGEEDGAATLVADMRERIDAVTLAIADVEGGPRVFFELTSDLYTVAPNTFVGDLLARAKAANVAEGAESPFPQLTAEAIVEADPEVVLLADGEFGEDLGTVCARPGWDAVTACTSERVFAVDGDLTSRPGPRIVEGLELIARLLYPDRFE
jgi:iron complex transport system substrate-binding protein